MEQSYMGTGEDGEGLGASMLEAAALGVCSFTSGSFPSPPRDAVAEEEEEEEEEAEGVTTPPHQGVEGPESLSPSSLAFLRAGLASANAGSDGGGEQQQAVPCWSFPDQSTSGMSAGQEFDHLSRAKARGEERLKALMASKEHARRAFPRIRRVWKDLYLKIMVAGETGHGKTTFVNNMFLSYTSGKEVKPHDGSRTSVEDFVSQPDKLCAKFTIENDETMERVHYSIQDTPGYGDDTDISASISRIVDFVKRKNDEYLVMERDVHRTEALSARTDPRVDVCLYFIAAHRLKLIDVKFMQAISSQVSVIPIIAKADSMTAEETVSFRRFVVAECEKHKIRIFDFADEAKAAVGIPPDLVVPPFAVVASNKFDEVRGSGSYWPVRDYHWGTCEAFSTQHSDCTYLKKLLLEEGFHDLRRATEDRYLDYRREVFLQRQQADNRRRTARRRAVLAFLSLLLTALMGLALSLHGPDCIRKADPLGLMASVLKRTEVAHLSQKLKKKEHQLEMAEHKIDLLVKSVRDLEQHMTTLSALGAAGGLLGPQPSSSSPPDKALPSRNDTTPGNGGGVQALAGACESDTTSAADEGGHSAGTEATAALSSPPFLHMPAPLPPRTTATPPPPSSGGGKPQAPYWTEGPQQEQRFVGGSRAKTKWF